MRVPHAVIASPIDSDENDTNVCTGMLYGGDTRADASSLTVTMLPNRPILNWSYPVVMTAITRRS